MNKFLSYLAKLFNRRKDKKETNIHVKKNIPILYLHINGEKQAFLVDTGASSCVIDKRQFDLSEYYALWDTEIKSGFGDVQNVYTYSIPSMIDDTLFFITFVAADLPICDAMSAETGVKIIGVIGSEFFSKYKAVIDFKNLKLELYDIPRNRIK